MNRLIALHHGHNSLNANNIGDLGARGIAEGLKHNNTIKKIT